MSFLPEPDYENDPATITVKIAGEERPWYLGAESFEIAREQHGLEPGDILQDSVTGEEGLEDGIESVVGLVWIGFLVFDDSVEKRDVKRLISFPPEDELIDPINEHMNKMNDEEAASIMGKGTAAGS